MDDQAALDFLLHILPEEGWLCATVIGERRFNTFFDDYEKLLLFIKQQDEAGNNVYHACATFKTDKNRKQENVHLVRAFWLDADCGEGKAYANANEAFEASNNFCQQYALPAPTYVGSGRGLHIYWPLETALTGVEWKAHAQRLKLLCAGFGFQVDRVRTADSSSILRTPGTRNWKYGADCVVQVGELTGPYKLEDFCFAKETQTEKRPARAITAKALNVYSAQPSDINKVVADCAQIQRFVALKGCLPEPDWHGGIGVFAFCSEGDNACHEASSGYEGYTHEETQERLDRWKALGAPTTCAHFQSINPEGCRGCPHAGKITTPVQLGRTGSLPREILNGHDVFENSNFLSDKTGLWLVSENKKGEPSNVLICKQPIKLTTIQIGELDTSSYSLAFETTFPRGTRTIGISAKALFGNSGSSEMHGRGAIIHEPDLFKRWVREEMDNWHKGNELATRFEQFGWKGDETQFLIGQYLYGPKGPVLVPVSDLIQRRVKLLGPVRKGSLAEWQRAANMLFQIGCEPQSFVLLASFGAVLMRFITAGEGGAIIALTSDPTAKGKTTALAGAGSVWGTLKGVRINDDDTGTAKNVLLGMMGNLPVTYDELYGRDPDAIRKFVMMFTNGSDRERATREGGLVGKSAEWQTLMLLASNASLVDILMSVDASTAPAYRVLEFVCSIPRHLMQSDWIQRTLDDNGGWAGDYYLQHLVQPEMLAYVKDYIVKISDYIWEKTKWENDKRFWVRALACVATAGMVVNHIKLLDISPSRILEWGIEQLQNQTRFKVAVEERDYTEVLNTFLLKHAVNDTLVVLGSWKPQTVAPVQLAPRKDLIVRQEKNNGRAFILESALKKHVVGIMVNYSAFIDELRQRKIIVNPHRRITLGAGTEYASGQSTCVEINLQHPAMSGVVIEVEKLIPERTTHAQRIEAYNAPRPLG